MNPHEINLRILEGAHSEWAGFHTTILQSCWDSGISRISWNKANLDHIFKRTDISQENAGPLVWFASAAKSFVAYLVIISSYVWLKITGSRAEDNLVQKRCATCTAWRKLRMMGQAQNPPSLNLRRFLLNLPHSAVARCFCIFEQLLAFSFGEQLVVQSLPKPLWCFWTIGAYPRPFFNHVR